MSEDQSSQRTPLTFSNRRNAAEKLLSSDIQLSELDADLISDIFAASIGTDIGKCEEVLARAIERGVPEDRLTDRYIPTVARMLGESWCADQMAFAQVTIGVARLRGVLKTLDPLWSSDLHSDPSASTVLLVCAKGAQHTFGATLLAGQLRRRGISVKLQLDASPADVEELMAFADYDGVLISASIGESLETLKLIVEATRRKSGKQVPTVLGGTIAADERSVQKLTTVDLVSVDLDEAISFCRLKTKTRKKLSAEE